MAITSYKCPNCSADIPYDASVGKLKCKYCGTEYDIENLEAFNVEQEVKTDVCDWNIQDQKTVAVDGKISYVCPSCGAEVVGDENMAATSCPYCGTAIIVGEQLSGMLEPNLVIPFKLTKEDAKNTYAKFISNKKLLPDDFKVNNIIDKLNGVYVPYWLFDGDVSGQARFRATRSRVYIQGDYQINETSHYLVYRDGDAKFTKVPVDASTKLDDALLDALEPFDYSEAKPYNSAYLANFLADKYDQDKDASISKANSRMKNTVEALLASSVIGYDTVLPQGCSFQVANGTANYALLPIYIFSTKYNGKVYQFAMNGQTGKFAGDLPMDKTKATVYSLLIFLGVFIVAFLIIFFMSKGGM